MDTKTTKELIRSLLELVEELSESSNKLNERQNTIIYNARKALDES